MPSENLCRYFHSQRLSGHGGRRLAPSLDGIPLSAAGISVRFRLAFHELFCQIPWQLSYIGSKTKKSALYKGMWGTRPVSAVVAAGRLHQCRS
jgi:hypothetical protein